jgi:ATP-dependent Clp protease ATP-binding subunit ClpC
LNRLDDVIVFHQLTREQVLEIANLMLDELKARLQEEHEITLTLDQSANELLIEQGYDSKYGARPMRRAIERLMENPISELILNRSFERGAKVTASADGDEMRFTRSK